jgi:hypothetical protein
MVIHESLRLYPPVPVVFREALEDLKFGDIHVPKGFIVWTLLVTLHQDPDIWGPDAKEFNPEGLPMVSMVHASSLMCTCLLELGRALVWDKTLPWQSSKLF